MAQCAAEKGEIRRLRDTSNNQARFQLPLRQPAARNRAKRPSSSRSSSANTETTARPRSRQLTACIKYWRATRYCSPGTPNTSPIASDTRRGTALDRPSRRPSRSIHRRWLA